MKVLLLLALVGAPAVLATVNGRCSGQYNDGFCICVSKGTCKDYHGQPIPGSKGNYPCPSDGPDIIGCVKSNCKGDKTGCAWNDYCAKNGKPLKDPVCPGGSNYVCCKY